MTRAAVLAGWAALLLIVSPGHAQEGPAWAGVWEGRVGDLPVRACVNAWGDSPGRGSYYYLRHLEPIALIEQPDDGYWVEQALGSDQEPQWRFAELSDTRMRGSWQSGRRILPFALSPVAWQDATGDGPCGSEAFLGALLEGGRVSSVAASQELAGSPSISILRHTYRPPDPLAEDVSIETFTVPERTAGDPAVNAALRAALPQDGSDDEMYQCLATALSAFGTHGWFNRTVTPTTLTRAFLGIEETSSTFCGGAHPNYWIAYRTFDRASGEEVDLFDWLGDARIDGEDSTLPPALLSQIFARWPALDETPECSELFAEAEYWSIGLAFGGLIFRPDFPHAATPCEESVTLDWQTLRPFLDAEGREGAARMRP